MTLLSQTLEAGYFTTEKLEAICKKLFPGSGCSVQVVKEEITTPDGTKEKVRFILLRVPRYLKEEELRACWNSTPASS